jgi:Zn-finger nucleic acid-binding protein
MTMRLLVACLKCHRQYDATGRRVGSRFHCHCGSIVTVRRPKGRDCAVVRCSSCGAPRQAAGESCAFCHSDFTLHERDLHTVCPACLARVSDRASYCHHCGVGLAAEHEAGDASQLNCPACPGDRRLVSRPIGQERIAVLECGRCAGLWLGQDAFRQLTERAASQRTIDPAGAPRPRPAGQPAPSQSGARYRPCIVCGNLMVRRHYGRSSGVIVDFCKTHGVWFDADELARILGWIRAVGAAAGGNGRDGLQGRKSDKPAAKALPATAGHWDRGEQGTSDFVADLLQAAWTLFT